MYAGPSTTHFFRCHLITNPLSCFLGEEKKPRFLIRCWPLKKKPISWLYIRVENTRIKALMMINGGLIGDTTGWRIQRSNGRLIYRCNQLRLIARYDLYCGLEECDDPRDRFPSDRSLFHGYSSRPIMGWWWRKTVGRSWTLQCSG